MAKIIIFLFYTVINAGCYAEKLYPFVHLKQEAQFNHLLKELRCLVCQNQDLSDSSSSLAKDLRNEVYRLVTAGNSDQEVIAYLTARYGDFILFNPPVKMLTILLWLGPAVFFILGLLMFCQTCLRAKVND